MNSLIILNSQFVSLWWSPIYNLVYKFLPHITFLVAENYVNLGEIQASTAPSSENPPSSATPGLAPESTPASAPGTLPISAPGSAPLTPRAAAPPRTPPLLEALPPPVPPENAVAAVSASSPPKEETDGAPVAVNPVHAPQLKLLNECSFEPDGKSSMEKADNKKGSKGSASEPRKKKMRGTMEDDEEYKKPKKYYFARGCYGFCFILFLSILISWALVASVALNFVHIEFFEKMLMNFG